MNYLPSKKLVLVFGSLIFTLGLVWFVSAKSTTNPALHGKKNTNDTGAIAQKDEITDTDGDTIPDWQEVLAGTDPRDPNSKPSKDQLATKKPLDSASISTEGISPTTAIFQNFMQLFQNPSDNEATLSFDLNDPQTQALFIQTASDQAKQFLAKQNPYSEKDIRVDTSISLKDYFNEVAAILQKNFPEKKGDPNTKNEITVIYSLTENLSKTNGHIDENEFTKKLAEIAPYKQRYATALGELKNMSVPKEAASLHLNFINSFSNIALALDGVGMLDKDPILGALGLKLYANEIISGSKFLAYAKDLIDKNKITFGADEAGYQFQHDYLTHSS